MLGVFEACTGQGKRIAVDTGHNVYRAIGFVHGEIILTRGGTIIVERGSAICFVAGERGGYSSAKLALGIHINGFGILGKIRVLDCCIVVAGNRELGNCGKVATLNLDTGILAAGQ